MARARAGVTGRLRASGWVARHMRIARPPRAAGRAPRPNPVTRQHPSGRRGPVATTHTGGCQSKSASGGPQYRGGRP